MSDQRLVSLQSKAENGNETFLTEEDYLRPLDDQEIVQLTDLDFENAKKFNDEIVGGTKSKRHVLTQQKYYRGDIRGKAAWGSKTKEGARRNGVVAIIKRWPNGRIPYVLSAQYNERERAVLARAFQEYQTKTCIRFVPKSAFDTDYLYIGKIDGCFSDVGKAGGRQELSLDDGCLQYDTAIHELMHSIGFYHEHERWDRDKFISIMWHNIDREAYDQFGKVDLTESSYYGQNYDYNSIMHYDSMAFSKNGFETLIAKQPEMTAVIGSAIDFSPVDLVKIRKMYNCPDGDQVTSFSAFTNNALPQALSPVSAGIAAPIVPPQSPPLPPIAMNEDPCVDKTTLCWRWLDRCQSFFFEKIMKEFCALSCGFCTPSIVPNPVIPQTGPQISLPQIPGPPNPPFTGPFLSEEKPYYQRFG
uniref:Metalloendopeptidase n=1 Tax=Panagrolaimus sp. JU765 TaxID=591449 RepID=A0AC34QK96_9BILA